MRPPLPESNEPALAGREVLIDGIFDEGVRRYHGIALTGYQTQERRCMGKPSSGCPVAARARTWPAPASLAEPGEKTRAVSSTRVFRKRVVT